MVRFQVVDWFSSVGGFSSQAPPDHDVVAGVDCDVEALRCFQTSFKEAKTACRTLPATLPECKVPIPSTSTFWHFSPPCVAFSSARRSCTSAEEDEAVKLLAWSIEMAIRHGIQYSIENVATEIPLSIASRYRESHPHDVDFEVLCSSSFGVPQRRRRLIISRPEVISLLRDQIAKPRLVNMETAFARRNISCPGTHVKNATTCKAGPCMRAIDDFSVTLVSSRPVHFLRPSNKWTAATEKELRTLMDLPESLTLPSDKRGAVRAIGNAVAGGVAKAILEAADQAAEKGARHRTARIPDHSELEATFAETVDGANGSVAWHQKRNRIKHLARKRVPTGLSAAAEKRIFEQVVRDVMSASRGEI